MSVQTEIRPSGTPDVYDATDSEATSIQTLPRPSVTPALPASPRPRTSRGVKGLAVALAVILAAAGVGGAIALLTGGGAAQLGTPADSPETAALKRLHADATPAVGPDIAALKRFHADARLVTSASSGATAAGGTTDALKRFHADSLTAAGAGAGTVAPKPFYGDLRAGLTR